MQKIRGVIKSYAWGGQHFIPQLVSMEESDQPAAEYWLGTHPDGTASIIAQHQSLREYLGRPLPYLFKVLDVKDMLSIQVHPNKTTAEAGYAYEESLEVPRSAPHRVYKDDNHKPELMVALSEFWLVQGFLPAQDLENSLARHEALAPLLAYYRLHGLQQLYQHIMTMDQEEVNTILKPIGKKIKPAYERDEIAKDDIDFWAARAYFTFNEKGRCDRGILSLYLMNLVYLNAGEAVYQGPGLLHAYLEGQNVECMAASDNVVRGGLTKKHMDPQQLVKVVDFLAGRQPVLRAIEIGPSLVSYPVPVQDFLLERCRGPRSLTISRPTIAFNLGEPATIESEDKEITMGRGEAAILTKDVIIKNGLGIDLMLAGAGA